MKELTLGILGLGTVGQGIYNLLRELRDELKEKYQLSIKIKTIVEKDSKKKNIIKDKNIIFTKDIDTLLSDDEINLVIEVIGGINPAKEIILTALDKDKSVITANKAVLAAYQDVIFEKAKKKNLFVGYRAALTGVHGVFPHLVLTGTIRTIIGILNGTCNYILTRMEEGLDFYAALKEAQQKGYAEAIPTLDINGDDTAEKLILVDSLTFSSICKKEDMYIEGIEGITLADVKFADELGYKIKLLGIIKEEKDKKDIRVHPALINKDIWFAQLKDIWNGLIIDDKFRGKSGVSSPGAGGFPAASAILTDLIAFSKGEKPYYPKEFKKAKLKNIEELITKYFLRFYALNKPGVLAKITSILGKFNINIRSVLQKPSDSKIPQFVPVIILTDDAEEANIRKAIRMIDKLNVIEKKIKLIRVVEEIW